MVLYSGLFHHCISGVTRKDLAIDRKAKLRDWTFPYLVIAPALADKETTMFAEDFLNLARKAPRH